MSLTLRTYQSGAIQGIYNYFHADTGNPLVVIPTAGGKSLVMATFVEGVLKAYPDQRILIVTHVRELIEQNHAELMRLWPEAPAGIYSAGLKQRDIGAQILFAGIQSIHKRIYDVQQCDLVLIDEAHLIPRSSNTMYRRFLDGLKRINPLLKVIGLTATPYRLDSGLLHEGDDSIFTDIAYEVSVRELIDAGLPVTADFQAHGTQLDVTGVGTRGGEFIARDLEAAIDKDSITQSAVEEIFAYGQGPPKLAGLLRRRRPRLSRAGCHPRPWRHAARPSSAIRPAPQREAIITAFKRGEIRCLTNANVLTTGFNAPAVDLIAMLRPTKSAGLYVQIVGRGCRLAPGKDGLPGARLRRQHRTPRTDRRYKAQAPQGR